MVIRLRSVMSNILCVCSAQNSLDFPHPARTNQVEEIVNRRRFIIVVVVVVRFSFFLSVSSIFSPLRIKNNGWMTTESARARVMMTMIYLCDRKKKKKEIKQFNHRKRRRLLLRRQWQWQWQWQWRWRGRDFLPATGERGRPAGCRSLLGARHPTDHYSVFRHRADRCCVCVSVVYAVVRHRRCFSVAVVRAPCSTRCATSDTIPGPRAWAGAGCWWPCAGCSSPSRSSA